jgi:hypothetical protein
MSLKASSTAGLFYGNSPTHSWHPSIVLVDVRPLDPMFLNTGPANQQGGWSVGTGLRIGVRCRCLDFSLMGDYTGAIVATVVIAVLFTVPVVWQFLQPNDDDFGDLSKKPKQ